MTKSKCCRLLKMRSSSINVLVLLLDQRTKEALVDLSRCIIVIIFVILHRLFLANKLFKLTRFRVPHTFYLDLELCHLDAEEFLWGTEIKLRIK